MTFTLPFLNTGPAQSSADRTASEFEADRSMREFLRELIFSNYNAIQSDWDIAALITQYPRQF
jgi:hypothetical protein